MIMLEGGEDMAGGDEGMVYEYEIYEPGSRNRVIAAFESEVPLPHIQVGHALWLDSPDFESRIETRLVISDVELAVSIDSGDEVERVRVMIYLKAEERTLER